MATIDANTDAGGAGNAGARKHAAPTVLVIEDDLDVAAILSLHLQDAGHRVVLEHHGERALARVLSEPFDLVILDLGLPGLDGLEICKRQGRESQRPPLLILSARSAELDRVLGLELGADDYLTKPFSVRELVARARALLRRSRAVIEPGGNGDTSLVRVGSLVVDCWARCARLDGVPIELTSREFDLLLWFARHPGRVFSRAELLDEVWGEGYNGFEHTVNSHLNRLRAKLEPDPAHPALLITVRGAGYKLVSA